MNSPPCVNSSTCVVLDTNAVLDWLVFADPAAQRIGAAVCNAQLRWIATPDMLTELHDVLGRLLTHPPLQRWQAAHAPASAEVGRRVEIVRTPEPLSPTLRLHCTDPDDQCFIDLALATRTPWLITRDRALLRLARRARPHGVAVLTPAQWCAATAPAA
jgi:predicted nucleic acid-binding protein